MGTLVFGVICAATTFTYLATGDITPNVDILPSSQSYTNYKQRLEIKPSFTWGPGMNTAALIALLIPIILNLALPATAMGMSVAEASGSRSAPPKPAGAKARAAKQTKTKNVAVPAFNHDAVAQAA